MSDHENYANEVQSAMQRIMTHEQVCAERYEQIKTRLTRMESWFSYGCGAIIFLLAGILAAILTK
jgi:hypothetical protein